jgi:transcriptional regulator with XRE-family HTH domain
MLKGIGKRIKELRDERDISMDMLVADMNTRYPFEKPLNKSMLSRWENDINNPTLDAVKYLCDYFDVSVDYMLGITEVKTPVRHLREKRRDNK